MQIDDRLSNRQAKAGALAGRLRGKKGVKHFGKLVIRNSMAAVVHFGNDDEIAGAKPFRAVIADIMTQCGQLFGPGAQGQASAGRHRMDGIDEKIKKNLLHLVGIDRYLGQ